VIIIKFHFLNGRAHTDIAKGNRWAEETGHVTRFAEYLWTSLIESYFWEHVVILQGVLVTAE